MIFKRTLLVVFFAIGIFAVSSSNAADTNATKSNVAQSTPPVAIQGVPGSRSYVTPKDKKDVYQPAVRLEKNTAKDISKPNADDSRNKVTPSENSL